MSLLPSFHRTLVACLLMGCVAFAQTGTANYVDSIYPIGSVAIGSTGFVLTITVGYPTDLSPKSYIAGSQFPTDRRGFLSGYPDPQDPPEAILSSILSSLLQSTRR